MNDNGSWRTLAYAEIFGNVGKCRISCNGRDEKQIKFFVRMRTLTLAAIFLILGSRISFLLSFGLVILSTKRKTGVCSNFACNFDFFGHQEIAYGHFAEQTLAAQRQWLSPSVFWFYFGRVDVFLCVECDAEVSHHKIVACSNGPRYRARSYSSCICACIA